MLIKTTKTKTARHNNISIPGCGGEGDNQMRYAAQKEVVLQAYSCLLKTRMLPGNAKKMTAYAFTATPDLKKKYAKKNVHVGTKKKSEKIGTNRKNDFLKLELESKKGQS